MMGYALARPAQNMGKTISATQAARQFSDLLNRVGFRGERYTIARAGKAIAHLTPATPPVTRRVSELPELLKQLPSLGKDAGPFALDVSRAIRHAPGLPRKTRWG
jgi:antitoxin (DNA-binding transcriptional repressor) of toxin-antitoxin stability system